MKTSALLAALVSLQMLTGCYSLTVQSQSETPVSLSRSTGTEAPVAKHFSRQYHQWYIIGLAPYDFWNGFFPDTQGLRAQEFVDFTLSKEAEGASGVTNLNVVTERNLYSWVLSLLANFIPVVGGFISGNMSVKVEGDVLN